MNMALIDDEPITTETDKELVIGTFTDKPLPPFPYDLVGATYTPKVQPHELAKLTMLNGTHMFIGALGRVVGENYIDEALQKPELRSLTEIFMAQVQGTLEPLAERNYDQYAEKLMDRFRNPFQHDPLPPPCPHWYRQSRHEIFCSLGKSLPKRPSSRPNCIGYCPLDCLPVPRQPGSKHSGRHRNRLLHRRRKSL